MLPLVGDGWSAELRCGTVPCSAGVGWYGQLAVSGLQPVFAEPQPFIYLLSFCDCFRATMAELNNCDKGIFLHRKSLLNPAVEVCVF